MKSASMQLIIVALTTYKSPIHHPPPSQNYKIWLEKSNGENKMEFALVWYK